MAAERSLTPTTLLHLGTLGLDEGAHLLVQRALADGPVVVHGDHPDLAVHLRAWARAKGHGFRLDGGTLQLTPGAANRITGAEPAGRPEPAGIVDQPPAHWGFAARGARVEIGTHAIPFALAHKDVVWSDEIPRLYAQAAAAQWDPATAIPWDAPLDHPEAIEDAVVQVMTYLIENETAALLVPARFLGQTHPHFREVMQLLAIQCADEARHIEVFTRRATLRRTELGLSTAGGQASLETLLTEPDFALASFLLSVLGEGSFLALLRFLAEHAPDPVTRAVCRLSSQDEARHVAFGVAHLQRHARLDPTLHARLTAAVHRRHDALLHTAGLNSEVFDALVLLAAGSFEVDAIRRGWGLVLGLVGEMDHGRRVRLGLLGFPPADAAALSALHTRNFM